MKTIHSIETGSRAVKDTVKAIMDTTELFGWFAKNLSLPVAMLDRQGLFVEINAEMSRLLRQPLSTLKGAALSQFVDYNHREVFARCLDQTLREGQSECELTLSLGQAENLVACLQLRFDRVLTGNHIYLLLHPEYNEHANESTQRLLRKMDTMREMSGAIAHKFNNLLMSISGNLQLLDEDFPSDAPGRDLLEEAQDSAHKATDLAAQMLLYLGKGKLRQEPISMVELIENMRTTLEQMVKAPGALKLQLDENTPNIHGNLRQIQQMIHNLINNASEALNAGPGTITLRTGTMDCDYSYLHHTYLQEEIPSGQYAWLEINDTGCGIDNRTLPRILDPFFTTKYPGRGLGLAIVLGIIQLHNGTIDVHSEPNKGTTIRVLIPAYEPSPENS